MVKTKRALGMALAVVFTTMTMLGMPAQAATKKSAKKVTPKKVVVTPAKVTTVDGPADEYQPGDPVEVCVKAANTKAKVQYRVSLVNAGKRVELYTAKTKFFGPALNGKAETTLRMKAFGVGTAGMVVYAKAVGSTKAYDSVVSYKFVVQPRPTDEPTEEPTEEPTVAPTAAPTVAPVTFAVSEVKAITEGAVTVTCEAISADQKAVTVKVLNPAGQTVEVNPVDLATGAKEATFAFKAAQTLVDGNYTVDGKTYAVSVPLAVSSVNAVDGTVTVKFNKTVTPAAVLADFTVNKTVTTTAAVTTAVVPTAIATTGTDVALTVPAVEQTTTDQAVVYSVAYKTDKAVDAPVYTVSKIPTLAIANATALNYREIVVTFNRAADAALLSDVANYTVTGLALTSATPAADNKSVTLLLGASIPNGGTAEVTVKAAIMGADTKVTTPAIADGTMPTVVGAAADGNSKIKVTFSEPVQTLGSPADYKLDGLYFGQSALPAVAGRVVTLAPSTRMTAGEHTLTVSSTITDFAGYGIITSRDVKFTVADDAVAPTVSFVSATQTKVVVKFSEKVATIPNTAFSFTNGVGVNTATADADGMTYTITTAGAIPAAGTTTITIAKANVADLFGNNPAADLTLTFTATADTTRPAVTGVAFATDDQTKLYVTFDKAVALDGLYTLTKTASDGTVTSPAVAHAYDKDADGNDVKTKMVLTIGTAYDPTASYKLQISGVTDTPNPLANKIVDYVVSGLKVADLTAPVYVSTIVNGQSIYITFDGALDPTTVVGSNFVYVKSNNMSVNGLPSGATASLVNSGKTIKLTWLTAAVDATNGLNPAADINQIQWTGLKGADTNAIAAGVKIKAAWSLMTAAPSMGAVEVTGAHTVTAVVVNPTNFIFDAAKAIADFKLKETGTQTLLNITNATFDATTNKITFTVYETIGTDATYGNPALSLTLYTVAEPTLVDIFNQAFAANVNGAPAADKYVPTATFTSAALTGGKVTLTFSETMQINGANLDGLTLTTAQDGQFIVLVNGVAKGFTAVGNGKTLEITVNGGLTASDVVNVKYFASPIATDNLVDVAGNKLGNLDLSATAK